MERLNAFAQWLNENRDLGYDLLRLYLGIGLLVRGVLFIGDPSGTIQQVIAGPEPAFTTVMVMHYVALAHLAGGLLLMLGLLTRIAAAIQVPILFGAVFLVHVDEGLLAAGQSLEFSALVLFMLVIYTFFGAGRWSADFYIFRNEEGPSFDDVVPSPNYDEESRPTPANFEKRGEPQLRKQELAYGASEQMRERCSCGHAIDDPAITVEPKYAMFSGLRFFLGISAPVKRVDFWCSKCGDVIERSREPEVLEKYRWHASG